MSALSEWGIGIFLLIILTLSLGVNALALLVLSKRPSLRTISNRFVINLLVCNLLCCLLLGPLVVLYNYFPKLVYLPRTFSDGATAFCTMATTTAVLLIATDQFMAVTDPLHYHNRITSPISTIMVVMQWGLSATFAVFITILPEENPSVFNVRHDEDNTRIIENTFDRYRIAYVSSFMGCFILSMIVTFSMFICISVAARKSAKPPAPPPPIAGEIDQKSLREEVKDESVGLLMSCDKKCLESETNSNDMEQNAELGQMYTTDLSRSLRSVLLDISKPYPGPFCLKLSHEDERKRLSHNDIYKITTIVPTHTGLKTVHSSPNFGVLSCEPPPPPPRSSSSYMSSLRCRISNASLFKYKEETRATRISLIVIFLVVFFQTPAAMLQVLPQLGLVPIYLLFVGSATFPFVFAYRNSRIQEELYRMCGRGGSSDATHFSQSLRGASSLSTEGGWRIAGDSSPAQQWNMFRAHAAATETSKPKVPDLLACPPGKSILKRVRAQSKIWSKKSKRCKFFQEPVHVPTRRKSLDSVPSGDCLERIVVTSTRDCSEEIEITKDLR